MTTAIVVYLLISCLMVYYFWSEIGWKKNSWRPYIFYLVIFLFWPIIFFIGIVYAFIVYFNDCFGLLGCCTVCFNK